MSSKKCEADFGFKSETSLLSSNEIALRTLCFQHLVVINNLGLSLLWIVQPTLFNLKINVVLRNGLGCLCKETISVGLSRLLAAIEFLPVSMLDWSLFSRSVFVPSPVSGRCLGSLAQLCEFEKDPVWENELWRSELCGSPMRGNGLAYGPCSQAQVLLLTPLRQQNQNLIPPYRLTPGTTLCSVFLVQGPPWTSDFFFFFWCSLYDDFLPVLCIPSQKRGLPLGWDQLSPGLAMASAF